MYAYTLRDELVYQLKRALVERGDLDIAPNAKHLIVDEYQDLNACDLAVIQAIRARGAEVYGAGDDDQSIYGFRYALPAGIRRFTETYAPAADLKLEICVRCDAAIIDIARFVAQLDPERVDKPLKPRDGAGPGEVLLLWFPNQYDEARGIASIARSLLDERAPDKKHIPDDVLILVRQDRYHAFSKPLVTAFAEAGVPLSVDTSSETPLDTKIGRGVLGLLRVCHHAEDSLGWRTLLSERAKGIGEGAFAALYAISKGRAVPFGHMVCSDDLGALATYGARLQAARTSLLVDLLAVGAHLETPTDGSTPAPLVDRITKAVAVAVPDEKQAAPIVAYLKRVVEESDAGTLADLLQIVSSSRSETEQQVLQPGAVNLLTMHRAKGLSARTVIVMAAEDEYIPGKQLGAQEGDERRLLYVSLTRAKERLIITYANKRTGQQQRMGRSTDAVRNLTRYLHDAPLTPKDGNAYVTDLGRR